MGFDADSSNPAVAPPVLKSAPAAAPLVVASGALGWLMFAHFANDLYVNFLNALLPLLAEAHHFSLGQAGLLVSISTISGSILQPVFGYVADSARLRAVAVVGLSSTVLGSSLLGVAPSYPALAFLSLLYGFGIAAFHPQSAGLVHQLSGERKGTRFATYIMAGQTGQALSPLIAAYIAVRAGLPWVAVTAIPGLIVAVVLLRVVPWHLRTRQRATASGSPESLRSALRQNLPGLIRLMGLVLSRSLVVQCMLALLPFLYRARGAPATVGAAAITAMVFAGALGGMAAGYLSDRYGRRRVLFVSFLLATPLFLGGVLSTGPASIILLALGGGALFGSSSLVTVEAQSLLPTHASTAAGLMMGLGMGMGGLLVGTVGALAQIFGIVPILTVVSLLPVPGSLLTLTLTHEARTHRQPSLSAR
jgi:FSR family fosmidomycin resistance protein-like MFS transporter